MKDIEYVLDFAAGLGCYMLESGANLERANDTMNRVCYSYGLKEVSIFSLSSIIQIGAKTQDGESAFRQVAVGGMDIHLNRLNELNRLSRRVCSEKPAPSSLQYLLDEAQKAKGYPMWLIVAGRIVAMGCMVVLFGGTLSDIVVTDLVSLCLIFLIDALSRANLNHIIVNLISMCFASSAAMLFYRFGLCHSFFVVIITCSMILIPGIALVNAFRNLLCGNEMNGILEVLKAAIETLAIVLGLLVGIVLFGGGLLW